MPRPREGDPREQKEKPTHTFLITVHGLRSDIDLRVGRRRLEAMGEEVIVEDNPRYENETDIFTVHCGAETAAKLSHGYSLDPGRIVGVEKIRDASIVEEKLSDAEKEGPCRFVIIAENCDPENLGVLYRHVKGKCAEVKVQEAELIDAKTQRRKIIFECPDKETREKVEEALADNPILKDIESVVVEAV